MTTRKNIRIASTLGRSGTELQSYLEDGRYSITNIAGFMSTTTQHLTNLLAEPAPLPLLPRNWTSDSGPGVYPPYIGGVPTVYSGPSTPGYTYGAPLAAREDFS